MTGEEHDDADRGQFCLSDLVENRGSVDRWSDPPQMSNSVAERDLTRQLAGDLTIKAPTVSLNDRPIPLTISGATPGREVRVVAKTHDADGTRWRSEMIFEADANGVVDPATHEPKSGTYNGIAPMGWLWSMRAPESDASFSLPTETASFEVTLEASDPFASGAQRLTRRTTTPGVTTSRPIDDPNVVGRYYRPSGDGPHPGVLVLHNANGTPDTYMAGLLASHGFATFALKYFGTEDSLPSPGSTIPLSYFDAAVDWLGGQNEVRAGSVGVVGKSQGGEAALLLGVHFDWVGAVIAYVPMTHAMWALGSEERPRPGWSLDGDPIPFVPPPSADRRERTVDGLVRCRPNWRAAFKEADRRTVREAAIDVERIEAPILLISAEDDQIVPSTSQCEYVVARLHEAGFEYPFEHLRYGDAGHRILAPYTPTANRKKGDFLVNGGTETGYAVADTTSWPTVLDYLDRGLGLDGWDN